MPPAMRICPVSRPVEWGKALPFLKSSRRAVWDVKFLLEIPLQIRKHERLITENKPSASADVQYGMGPRRGQLSPLRECPTLWSSQHEVKRLLPTRSACEYGMYTLPFSGRPRNGLRTGFDKFVSYEFFEIHSPVRPGLSKDSETHTDGRTEVNASSALCYGGNDARGAGLPQGSVT